MGKKKVISKKELRAIGERIFSERGYFLTKVSDIVKEAGVSQGTFYLNYESKKDLFIDILKDFRGQIVKILDDELFKNLPPQEALILSQKRLFSFFMDNKTTTVLIYREGYVEKEFSQILEDIHKILTNTRAKYLKEIFKDKLAEEDRESLSYMIGGILRGLFLYYEKRSPEKNLYEAKIEKVIDGFLRCVGSGLES